MPFAYGTKVKYWENVSYIKFYVECAVWPLNIFLHMESKSYMTGPKKKGIQVLWWHDPIWPGHPIDASSKVKIISSFSLLCDLEAIFLENNKQVALHLYAVTKIWFFCISENGQISQLFKIINILALFEKYLGIYHFYKTRVWYRTRVP